MTAPALDNLDAARQAMAAKVARRRERQARLAAELDVRAKEAAEARQRLAASGEMPTPRQIVALVAAEHRLNVHDLTGQSRTKPIVAARWAAVKEIAETYPHRSRAWVGQWVNRGHSVVYHVLCPDRRERQMSRERERRRLLQQSEVRHAA
jgi:chromosomal replication initiation ATPase DnaA